MRFRRFTIRLYELLYVINILQGYISMKRPFSHNMITLERMPQATVMCIVTNGRVSPRTINIEIGPRFCMTSTKQNIYPLCTHCPSRHICLPSYSFMLIWSGDGWSVQLQKTYFLAPISFKLQTSDRHLTVFVAEDSSKLTNQSQ